MPASVLSLRAYQLEPSLLWAPPAAYSEVFTWACNVFIAHQAASAQPFMDLPDDCAGDVLEFLEISMTHMEMSKVNTHCFSPEAYAWVHAVVYAGIAVRKLVHFYCFVPNLISGPSLTRVILHILQPAWFYQAEATMKLHQAAHKDDLASMQECLEKGADIDAQNEWVRVYVLKFHLLSNFDCFYLDKTLN